MSIDVTKSGGNIKGIKWAVIPGYENQQILSSNAQYVASALQQYLGFLKSKGIDCTVEIRSKDQSFTTSGKGIFEILIYYPNIPQ